MLILTAIVLMSVQPCRHGFSDAASCVCLCLFTSGGRCTLIASASWMPSGSCSKLAGSHSSFIARTCKDSSRCLLHSHNRNKCCKTQFFSVEQHNTADKSPRGHLSLRLPEHVLLCLSYCCATSQPCGGCHSLMEGCPPFCRWRPAGHLPLFLQAELSAAAALQHRSMTARLSSIVARLQNDHTNLEMKNPHMPQITPPFAWLTLARPVPCSESVKVLLCQQP